MSTNDRILLDNVLSQGRSQRAPSMSESDFFELFAAEQVLKDFDLSYEEITSGIVAGGGDGGVDSVFLFANGELVHEDTDLAQLKRGVQLELVIIQATTSPGVSESRVDKLVTTTEDLFDLARDLRSPPGGYNGEIVAAVSLFRDVQQTLAARFPKLQFRYVIASKGSEVHPNVISRGKRLSNTVSRLFSDADCTVEFLGASDLLKLARRTPRTSYSLQLAENPISSAGQGGFVCLVRLGEFYNFVTDTGTLQRHLFEANVRDYQGTTEVNAEIKGTLATVGAEDFWWLNNGVTILASRAVLSGKTLTIEDPQIVNGLQTSTEIFNHFNAGGSQTDERTILVRVVVPGDPASRDKIIKATNSQTSIPSASLRATDKIHRDIEEFLKPLGFFYDRRKNFYRNEGVAVEKIVPIPVLAQAVMAIALGRPDNARSRPSSLLKKDDDYRSIFSSQYRLELYHRSMALMKLVEAFLRSISDLSPADRGNIRFHVAMTVASLSVGVPSPGTGSIAGLDPGSISQERLQEATELVRVQYEDLGATDAVAKSAEFLARVKESLGRRLGARTGEDQK
jgi:hypothetical protein